MQILPGFRDFYPEDLAKRNYIFSTLRRVARSYGFLEIDGPFLERTDLYRKKSGGELIGQLYQFVDKGGREVAMRPEMTPSIARMIADSGNRFRKPLKWFGIGSFFRYERQQKGRLREFAQLNCDLIGESSPSADAELLALLIDSLRAFGLTSEDFVLRLSDRNAWVRFLYEKGLDEKEMEELLQLIDKIERPSEENTEEKLARFGITLQEIRDFIEMRDPTSFRDLLAELSARGLSDYVEIDLRIVRGLLYYTGIVFEVFDRKKELRAVAGGGRYDRLIATISDGKVDLPAIGFGLGDVVLSEIIAKFPAAEKKMRAALAAEPACQIYVVIADVVRRPQALKIIQDLRQEGWNVDFSLVATRVSKQFQIAEQLGARLCVIVGSEWPQVKFKRLATREEFACPQEMLSERLKNEEQNLFHQSLFIS